MEIHYLFKKLFPKFPLLLHTFQWCWFFGTEIKNAINIHFNLLKPTGHVMHHQFNIQQLYVLPTLYLWVLFLSENKQRLVPLTA